MTPNEIRAAVIKVLRDVQSLSGRPWVELDAGDEPIGDLDGFDSLSGVEATVLVEKELGQGELGTDSLFVSEDGKRALSLGEIVLRIDSHLRSSGAKA